MVPTRGNSKTLNSSRLIAAKAKKSLLASAVTLIVAAMVQVEDDRGPLARRLGGFRGQAFAVGPIARYTFQAGQTRLSAALSWAPEFGVRNRTEGHALYLRLVGAF